MSYNGSGTFQINTSGQPVVAGTVISSTAFNALTADLATGLSTAITKDGQTTATARIPFAAGINSTLVTDSTNTTSGSIITAGGVGIAKALYVGTTANIAGTTNLAGLTASSAVATDASKNLVSVTNTGTGNNVLATSPTITTPTISQLSSAAATALTLQSAGTTAVTIDTAQNVGVGVTPSAWSGGKAIEVGFAGRSLWGFTQTVGYLTTNAYYNSGFKYGGTGAATAYEQNAGAHVFYSAASGTAGNAITNTQAMTLDASGNLLVGKTTAAFATAGVTLTNGGSDFTASGADVVRVNRLQDGILMRFASNTVNQGSISIAGSTTTYSTSSDYRLKNTIAPMTGALAKVALLKPCTYKWNADGSDGQGFIAHELAEVISGCVTGEKDAVDSEGKPDYQGVDTSFLVATLTAAIQELNAKFEAYKATHS